MNLKECTGFKVPVMVIFLELGTERKSVGYMRPCYVSKLGRRKLKHQRCVGCLQHSSGIFLKTRIGVWKLCFAFSRLFHTNQMVQPYLEGQQGSMARWGSWFSASATSLGTAGQAKECGPRLTWSVLPFTDVNECELLSGVCGEAFCENVEGSFLCVCADENQEYSPMTGQCRSRAPGGKSQGPCGGVQSSSTGSVHALVWAKRSAVR